MAQELERVYVVPLRKAFRASQSERARKAIKLLREFASRHMKVPEENVIIENEVNEAIWARGARKPPRRIRVKMRKEGEKVIVSMMP